MIQQLLNSIAPGWQPEYKFHPSRKWRFDYAHVHYTIAVEIEGGVWKHGRHNQSKGFLNDCEKYNQAQILGWKVLRYAPGQEAQMTDDVRKLVNELERLRPI